MGIEDIQISEELETNAPSIKYSGNEGPKSPQEMERMIMAQLEEEYSKYVDDMLEQGIEPMSLEQFLDQAMAEGQMSGGQPLPQDPTKPVNPFQPKPTGPVLPDKRQMAAYGGIMGMDGRKQYGIGSFFQKYIKDPIEMAVTGKSYEDLERESQARVDREPEGYEGVFDRLFKGEKKEKDGKEYREGGLDKYIIPAVGGIAAGLFTKNTESDTPGLPSDTTALALDDLKKSANILDQKQGMAAGLNFLPAVSARKFTPEEMIETYKAAAANGGRIGFNMGGGADYMPTETMTSALGNREFINSLIEQMLNQGSSQEEIIQTITEMHQGKPQMAMGGRIGFNNGGGFSPNDLLLLKKFKMNPKEVATYKDGGAELLKSLRTTYIPKAEGGIMDLGGMEKDYRAEGGFVPIGKQEKADDVPARLSVNEFVFTADAVRNAGGGDIDQGAEVMENMMKHLEQGGQVSKESQGMAGARDMFATSQRLGDVI